MLLNITISSLVTAYFIMHNKIYLSDKIIYLIKYNKSINLKEVISIKSDIKSNKVEIDTSDNKYIFIASPRMIKEIEIKLASKVNKRIT